MTNRLANGAPSGWSDLCQEMALKVAAIFVVFSWPLWYRQISGDKADLLLLAVVSLGAWTPLAAVLMAGSRARLTAAALVATPLLAAYVASARLGYQQAITVLVIPILVAPFLLSPLAALPVAALSCLVALAQPASAGLEARLFPCLLFSATGLVAVVLADGLRGNLWHAWRQAENVATLMHEVRLRQGEVNRLNKALQVSNGLLKRSIRELALAQREAAEARHLKEQFATTVSHELRTPLNVILGFLEVMQRYSVRCRSATGWLRASHSTIGW